MVGGTFTMVTFVEVLFTKLMSVVIEPTVTVFVMGPDVTGRIVTERLLVEPLANELMLQLRAPAWLMKPGVAETKLTPAGKASVTVTLNADDEPRFATANV
jgi:hypothetical protein